MHHRSLPLAFALLASFASACGGDDTTGSSSTTGGTTKSTATGTGGGTTSTATTGAGGAGGAGGGTTSTTTTGAGGGTAGDHLLISELAVAPGPAEFVEIYNPTASAVDLTDYFLSDNSAYVGIASGAPWAPVTSNPGTDFLAQFPAGTSIPADGVLVVASDPGFETAYGTCPDFYLAAAPVACGGNMVPPMLAPANGGIGDKSGTLLSNDREMVVLFHWDGVANVLEDVDYLTWGTMFDDNTRADKTGLAGYQPDTARASQKPAGAPPVNESTERCQADAAETLTDGNGITGHDETSEDLGTAFVPQATPNPGTKPACL